MTTRGGTPAPLSHSRTFSGEVRIARSGVGKLSVGLSFGVGDSSDSRGADTCGFFLVSASLQMTSSSSVVAGVAGGALFPGGCGWGEDSVGRISALTVSEPPSFTSITHLESWLGASGSCGRIVRPDCGVTDADSGVGVVDRTGSFGKKEGWGVVRLSP